MVTLASKKGHQRSNQFVKELRRMEVFAVLRALAFIRGNVFSDTSEGDGIQARVVLWLDRNQVRDEAVFNTSHILPEEVEALVKSELLPILTCREAQGDEHTCATGQQWPYDDPIVRPHGG